MKNVLFAAILSLCALVGHASCFEGPTRLLVRKKRTTPEMTYYEQLTVRFSPATPIAAIKRTIYRGDGIAILTTASEPGEAETRLESDKTCAYYGIQNGQILNLTVTSKERIVAEFQASTPLNNNVIGVVLSYDPDFHQATQKS